MLSSQRGSEYIEGERDVTFTCFLCAKIRHTSTGVIFCRLGADWLIEGKMLSLCFPKYNLNDLNNVKQGLIESMISCIPVTGFFMMEGEVAYTC